MVKQNELVETLALQLSSASMSLGHKSTLDQLGQSYMRIAFTNSSSCYDLSHVSDATGIKILLGTIFADWERKGLLVKG